MLESIKKGAYFMDNVKIIMDYLPLFIPLVLLQLGLQIFCLVDLYKREKVRFNNKIIWVVIILCGEVLGSIIYLIFKGEESE